MRSTCSLSWSKSMTSINGFTLATLLTSFPTVVSSFAKLLLYLSPVAPQKWHINFSFRTFVLTIPCMAFIPISFRSLLKCHLTTKELLLTTLCKICLPFLACSHRFLFPYSVLLFMLITWHITYFSHIYLLFFSLY